MPPSGYSSREAGSIVEFLRCCSKALRAEAIRERLAPTDALMREIGDIRGLLDSTSENKAVQAVLQLTGEFYERVARVTPANFDDYDRTVAKMLAEIQGEILAVHVPPELHKRVTELRQLEKA